MIVYRDAGPDDSATIAGLFRRSFVETFGHLYREEDLAAFLRRADAAGYREELQGGGHWIRWAEAGGEPAGFVKLGPLSLPVETRRRALEFRQLYILGPWQGAGIAQALTSWAIGQARERGAEELYLSVYVDNERAKAFYRRYGFAYVGPYRFMVGEQADEDEIWMLELDPR
jgi:ribosomal protein S18 acetylase RimI-like enzyme